MSEGRFTTLTPETMTADQKRVAIIMAGRKWAAQYEFHAHRRLAIEAGLKPAIADAIAANERPAGMATDETMVYEFVSELLATGHVLDPVYQLIKDAFGERGVIDLIGAVGSTWPRSRYPRESCLP